MWAWCEPPLWNLAGILWSTFCIQPPSISDHACSIAHLLSLTLWTQAKQNLKVSLFLFNSGFNEPGKVGLSEDRTSLKVFKYNLHRKRPWQHSRCKLQKLKVLSIWGANVYRFAIRQIICIFIYHQKANKTKSCTSDHASSTLTRRVAYTSWFLCLSVTQVVPSTYPSANSSSILAFLSSVMGSGAGDLQIYHVDH